MANFTLLDIANISGGSDGLRDLVEETIKASPEAKNGSARTIEKTTFETIVRTSLPTVGFRNANEGAATVKSTYKKKLASTYIMDAPIEMDKAIADAHEDGPEAVLAIEGESVLEAAWRALSSQFYYGNATTVATSSAGSPTKGFPGLVEVVDSSLVVDAGGSGAARSSVWAVFWGPRFVQWLLGNNGEIASDDPRIVRLTDSNSNPYDGYRIPFLAYPGLKVHNKNAVGRIKNITEAEPVTDDDIFNLFSQFPAGMGRPDVLYMTQRTLEGLRASRTATNATGAPAPTPTEVGGVPIEVTDGISNAEAA